MLTISLSGSSTEKSYISKTKLSSSLKLAGPLKEITTGLSFTGSILISTNASEKSFPSSALNVNVAIASPKKSSDIAPKTSLVPSKLADTTSSFVFP